MTSGEPRPRPRARAAEDVVVERMEGSSILIHLATNRMFELNETGTRFWDLLVEGHDVGWIKERLLLEYDVDAPTLDREVDDLLARLEAERLVVHEPAD